MYEKFQKKAEEAHAHQQQESGIKYDKEEQAITNQMPRTYQFSQS